MTEDLTFRKLQHANDQRNMFWDPQKVLNGAFFGLELAGEVGEACNIIKKLERARLGVAGSRAPANALAEELADVAICLCLVANYYYIDLDQHIVEKFNASSTKLDFPVTL